MCPHWGAESAATPRPGDHENVVAFNPAVKPPRFVKPGVAALLCCSASSVFAQQGGVTLYGLLDSGIAYQAISGPDKYTQTKFGVASGMQTTSRWGLRGHEPLGGGYSLNFVVESSLDVDTGASLSNGRLFGLQSWVGVGREDGGYFRLGRQSGYAPEFFLPIDPFRGGLGQARMAFAFGAANSNTKYSNMIKLLAEPVEGLKFGVGYSFAPQMTTVYFDGNQAISTGSDYNFGTMNNTRLITTGVSYASGPLTFAATYDQVMPNTGDASIPNNLSGGTKIREWIVGGKYDFGMIQLSAAVGQNRGGVINMQGVSLTTTGKPVIDPGTWGGGQGAMLFDPEMSFNSYMLGFTLPLGDAAKIFSAWTRAANTSSSRSLNGVGAQDAYSIGYQYDFTKRTNLYVAASYATNIGFNDGTKSAYLLTGVRHRF